jgi:hypothetical protein
MNPRHAVALALVGWYLTLLVSGCTQATALSEQHEQERQKAAGVERTFQHCLQEDDAGACREVWNHQIEVCGRGGAMDLSVTLTNPNVPNLGWLSGFRPACDSVTKGDAFWSRYPTAANCRDSNLQACAEVCHLAFDESGGWSEGSIQPYTPTRGGNPAPLRDCDALFSRHYWPCLASRITVKEIFGPFAASACAKPGLKIRCSHEGPNAVLTCEPATN